MKKIQLLTLAMLLCVSLTAQTYPPEHLDTLSCDTLRQPNFFYSEWYDTCQWFRDPENYTFTISTHSVRFRYYSADNYTDSNIVINPSYRRVHSYVFQQYTPNPIKVRGIWIMVSPTHYDPNGAGSYDHVVDASKLPEYVYLYRPDTTKDWSSTSPREYPLVDHLERIATARWDTLTPKMICLPTTADVRFGYRYCLLYEIPIDTAVTVDGEFWIGGTVNSNDYNSRGHAYAHFPTLYLSYGVQENYTPYRLYSMSCHGPDGPWDWCFYGSRSRHRSGYGPVGTIMSRQWLLMVTSADTAQGHALTTGYYSDSTSQTITAVPHRGYRFLQWNDGNTDNPRTVFLTSDTAFTAHFEEATRRTVATSANDSEMGHVSGGGQDFYDGDTATLEAIAFDGYRFSHWNDANTDNPRRVEVLSDTAFTAYFEVDTTHGSGDTTTINPVGDALPGLFTLTPNPTTGEVTVLVNSEKLKDNSCTVTVLDAAGHEVLRTTLNFQLSTLNLNLSSLPAGAYFVTLSDGSISATQKLILR